MDTIYNIGKLLALHTYILYIFIMKAQQQLYMYSKPAGSSSRGLSTDKTNYMQFSRHDALGI